MSQAEMAQADWTLIDNLKFMTVVIHRLNLVMK